MAAFTTAPKEVVTLRLDRDVVAYFRADGAGYQTRINSALRYHVDRARNLRVVTVRDGETELRTGLR